ncbi:MAG: glycoside hydrolase family 2 protein, partial [Terrimicrobiaceae bacterium]
WFNFRAKSPAVLELEKLGKQGWPHERAPDAFKAYGELPEARLLSLPKTKLSASVQRNGKHGTITVQNETSLPALNVIIEGFPQLYGNYLGDNSFCLYPGEKRTVVFDLASADETLEGFRVRAWNAEPVSARKP